MLMFSWVNHGFSWKFGNCSLHGDCYTVNSQLPRILIQLVKYSEKDLSLVMKLLTNKLAIYICSPITW